MPADWGNFIKDLANYFDSKGEKTPQDTADKIIDLYLDALSNKAQSLPGTSLFNKNDGAVIAATPALKKAFGLAMEKLQNDPGQQKSTFDSKKKDKNFSDPSSLDKITKIPPAPSGSPPDPFPPLDEKYYPDIIANSSEKFFIKQKDGQKSDKIFDYKTRVDFSQAEGYGIPLSIFGTNMSEVKNTIQKYGYLPGLSSLLISVIDPYDIKPSPGWGLVDREGIYDLQTFFIRRGVKATYGEIANEFVKIYGRGKYYREIGKKYKNATGATDDTLSAVIGSELAVITTLYAKFELQKWIEVAKPYIEKTAIEKAIKEIKIEQGLPESSKIEGEDKLLNTPIKDLAQSISSGGAGVDPYAIMGNALVLFWTTVGISSPTLFIGPVGVPPSVIAAPNLYQIIFPGIPFILEKGFRKAFNVGVDPKFIPDVPFKLFQKDKSAAEKKIEAAGKKCSIATASAIAAVFSTHLLTIKFLYFGQVPAAPSPVPAPAFVTAVY